MTARRPYSIGTRVAAIVAAAGLVASAACGDDDSAAQREEMAEEGLDLPASPDDSEPDVAVAELDLTLTEVASFDDEPLDLVAREGDDALFVAGREGRVFRLTVAGEGADRTYTVDEEPVLDISDEVVTDAERGLLGLAFSPDGERLYLSYSLAPSGETRVVSYDYTDGDEEAEPGIDPESRREIFAAGQPEANHNGGQILFGPDGFLYLGLGDGGGGGDPEDNGQDTSTLLGSILRIDPESTVEGDEPYAIPEDNPFADGEGGEPEIWLYGVRNPWRFSFDAVTGDLWVADVGQNAWEEINVLPAAEGAGEGANLGWNLMEGSYPFEGENPDGGVLPVYEYPIEGEQACAVVGGFVYSGQAIADLDGSYVYGDFCNPQVQALSFDEGQVTEATPLEGIEVEGLVSIAEDAEDELYFLSQSGAVYRLDP